MDKIGVIIILVSSIPMIVVNIKLEYEKAVKIHWICVIFLFFAFYSNDSLMKMSKLNQSLISDIFLSCFILAYSVPLYIKYKKDIEILHKVLKTNLIIIAVILLLAIYTFYEIN